MVNFTVLGSKSGRVARGERAFSITPTGFGCKLGLADGLVAPLRLALAPATERQYVNRTEEISMVSTAKKSDRMELRRAIGNRRVNSPRPSVYKFGDDYLVAHACFVCRRSFKLSLIGGRRTCPQCRGVLRVMGRAFRTPPHRDREQWLKAQALFALGFRFWRYGGPYEPLPTRLREVLEFVASHPRHVLRTEPVDETLIPDILR